MRGLPRPTIPFLPKCTTFAPRMWWLLAIVAYMLMRLTGKSEGYQKGTKSLDLVLLLVSMLFLYLGSR